MKTITLSAVLLILSTASAHADSSHGVWKGAGTTFDGKGQEQGDFAVEVTQAPVDEHTTNVRGVVTLASGQVITFTQRRTMNGNTFALEGTHGKGGGACFGAGLCTSYEDDGAGHSFSTTIIVDGSDKMRLLVTELERGRAVRFMRQTLSRAQ